MEFPPEETNVMVKVKAQCSPTATSENPDELMYITLTKDELFKTFRRWRPEHVH